MKLSIELLRERFNKGNYEKIIDTSFKEFTNGNDTPTNELVEKQNTVEDLFNMYFELFYDIPEEGDLSHETLIRESSEYVNFTSNQEEINALQEEITSLREQLLEQQQNNLDISNNLSQSINL